MEKTISVYIVVDDVSLSDLERIESELRKTFDKYPYKRINITIQDEPAVKPTVRQ
jgi:hypothetical protein